MAQDKEHNEAAYLAAVERVKAANEDIATRLWVIADEAAAVAKHYGENKLEQFAKDTNFDGEPSTLARMRSVSRAFPKTGARPLVFGSAQALQDHPKRIQIVAVNPEISRAEAREIMRKWHTDPLNPNPPKRKGGAGKGGNGEKQPEGLRDIREWLNKQVASVNDVINELNNVMENCTPAQRKLLEDLEPTLLLESFQKGEKLAAKFVDWVETPAAKAADKLIQEGRVRTTPARKAAHSVQAGA